MTAAQLVAMAAHNPPLLLALERLHAMLGVAGPLSIIVSWVAVPIVHHAPMPDGLAIIARRGLNIPPEADEINERARAAERAERESWDEARAAERAERESWDEAAMGSHTHNVGSNGYGATVPPAEPATRDHPGAAAPDS